MSESLHDSGTNQQLPSAGAPFIWGAGLLDRLQDELETPLLPFAANDERHRISSRTIEERPFEIESTAHLKIAGAELYGGQSIAYVVLAAGQSKTIAIP